MTAAIIQTSIRAISALKNTCQMFFDVEYVSTVSGKSVIDTLVVLLVTYYLNVIGVCDVLKNLTIF